MTKSFSLSALVPALSAAAATVPVAVWLDFSTPGRQGVSALPTFFTSFLAAALWARLSKSTNRTMALFGWLLVGSWHAFLWFAALTQPQGGGFTTALARALSELLYSASPALLAGVAGGVAALGLMMFVSLDAGRSD